MVPICLAQINDPDPLLRRWTALCLAKLWEDFEEAKWIALREGSHKRLCSLLTDPSPEALLPSIRHALSVPATLETKQLS